MIAATLLLLAPKPIVISSLFGQPAATVQKTLGKIMHRSPGTVDGSPTTTVTHERGTVTYLNERAYRIGIDFPNSPKMTADDALRACGYDPRGVLSTTKDALSYSDVWVQHWTLYGGSLPDRYRGLFTRRWTDTKTEEQSLWIEGPRSVALAPNAATRTAILDGIRPAFMRAHKGQKLKFLVDEIATLSGWAMVVVDPIAQSGDRLDVARSDFAKEERRVLLNRFSYALLKKNGATWKPVEIDFYDVDDTWKTWSTKHSFPKVILPDTRL
ncbi:hypothetical protein EON81_00995 [bacterium]|nr:MAG: hypothetical protein EON81_00995 [bacterium]